MRRKAHTGIGFAMGLERLLMVMENQGIKFPESKNRYFYCGDRRQSQQLRGKDGL